MSQFHYRLVWIQKGSAQDSPHPFSHRLETLERSAGTQVTPLVDSALQPASEFVDAFKFKSEAQAIEFKNALWTEITSATPKLKPPALVSFLPEAAFRTSKKLIVFDMDSTLINQEVIDEIARKAGFYDQVAAITEEAMQGKLDFKQSLAKRCALLAGLPRSEVLSILPTLTLSKGAEKLLSHAKAKKLRTAIVSGGFDFVLQHFQKLLSIDEIHAHHLLLKPEKNEEVLTGSVDEPIVDAVYKQKLVNRMKQSHHFSLNETVTVGDGANDIPMMSEAGISVSFCGKPKLNSVANTLILDRNLFWLSRLI